MNSEVDWVDLSQYGFQIVLASFEGTPNEKVVAIRGRGRLSATQEEKLRSYGFIRVSSSQLWAREGDSFRLSEIRDIFPQSIVRPMARKDFRVHVRGASPLRSAPPRAAATTEATAAVSGASPDTAAKPLEPRVSEPDARRPDPAAQDARPPQASEGPKPAPRAVASASPFGAPPPSAAVKIDLPEVSLSTLEDEVFTDDFDKVNDFQVLYKPKSRVGSPIATIPVNLAPATAKALDRLEDKYGNIDDWVAGQLDWTLEEMGKYLAPEQVDAVALAIEAATRGKGFILADQTGLGKGRVLATLLRWSVLHYGKAAFITEKANLFSDIWRDISDINSQDIFGTPFLLNDKSNIMDQESGEVIFEAPKKKAMDAILKSGAMPEDARLMLATYSQFNRKGSKKSEFLVSVCEDNQLVLDECHNIVGESNTRSNFDLALQCARAATYSSATFARNALNMGVYRSAFPDSIASLDLVDVLKAGGTSMLEALSQNLAEEGLLLRREHDLSNISIQVAEDVERADLHREFSDRMSPILAALARLAMMVSDYAEGMDAAKTNEKERWYAANFGARLSGIVTQFLTALEVDHCVELCVEAMKKGEKPVVVIESTMESLMREIIEDVEENGQEGFDEENDAARRRLIEQAPPPTFKDALALMLERIMHISCKLPQKPAEKVAVKDPNIVAEAERIREMIEGFPYLPLSPIDDIRERLEEAGRELHAAGEVRKPWVCGEISARGLMVRNGRYEPLEVQDRNITISAFNNGGIDALVVTRAASTGLSIHDSEKAKDHGRRVMIELQIPTNVVARQQFWGRVNRRGQLTEPRFLCLTTSLPYQTRILAFQNAKIATLSANVTGNAESVLTMDVPDIINDIGDEVCRKILEDAPKLARRMGIPMQINTDTYEQEFYYVNKLLSRLVLLPAQQQERLYRRVLDNYEAVMSELAARGRTPQQARVMDGKWKVVSRHLFDPGVPEDGAVFGRPVYLTTISNTRLARPLQSDDIRALLGRIRARHEQEFGSYRAGEVGKRQIMKLEEVRGPLLKSLVTKDYPNVVAALSAGRDNPVKRMEQRLLMIREFLRRAETGTSFMMSGDEEERVRGLLLDFTLASDDQVHVPSAYNLRYILPGDEKPRDIALSALLKDPHFGWHQKAPDSIERATFAHFDAAPSGEVVEVRRILDGNLFSAVRVSKLAGLGTSVSYEDETGQQRKGVLLPKNQQDKIHQIDGITRSPSVAEAVLLKGYSTLRSDPMNDENNITIQCQQNMLCLSISSKKRPQKNLLTEDLLKITGKFKRDWDIMSAVVPKDKADRILKLLISRGHSFHYEGRCRKLAIEVGMAAYGKKMVYQNEESDSSCVNEEAPLPAFRF